MKSRFEQIFPADYDSAAVLMREVGSELLARLDLVALKPERIMDVGCGVGYCTQLLHQRYPEAKITAIDDSENILDYAKQSTSTKIDWIHSSLDQLPSPDNSMDLIIANLILPWCGDQKKMLEEFKRVLRPEGLLMFATYGPDTLIELQSQNLSLPHFIDMHNLGDLLLQLNFADPVLDLDYFTLTYKQQQRLHEELYLTGFISKDTALSTLEKNENQVIPLTFEIIYAHTWKPEPTQHVKAVDGVAKFPLSHLRGR